METERNYCLATYHPDTQEPIAFAFMGIRSDRDAARALGAQMDLDVRPWIRRGDWSVAWEIIFDGPDSLHELQLKLWEMRVQSIPFEWCNDLIPEMPVESRVLTNTYADIGLAMDSWHAAADSIETASK